MLKRCHALKDRAQIKGAARKELKKLVKILT